MSLCYSVTRTNDDTRRSVQSHQYNNHSFLLFILMPRYYSRLECLALQRAMFHINTQMIILTAFRSITHDFFLSTRIHSQSEIGLAFVFFWSEMMCGETGSKLTEMHIYCTNHHHYWWTLELYLGCWFHYQYFLNEYNPKCSVKYINMYICIQIAWKISVFCGTKK